MGKRDVTQYIDDLITGVTRTIHREFYIPEQDHSTAGDGWREMSDEDLIAMGSDNPYEIKRSAPGTDHSNDPNYSATEEGMSQAQIDDLKATHDIRYNQVIIEKTMSAQNVQKKQKDLQGSNQAAALRNSAAAKQRQALGLTNNSFTSDFLGL